MSLRRLRARKTREWVCLLLLPALAFRLLVPAGFMPTAGEGFSVTMQMCHGDAKSSVVVRLTGSGEAPAGQHASHDAPCVFAASATVAPPSLAVGTAGARRRTAIGPGAAAAAPGHPLRPSPAVAPRSADGRLARFELDPSIVGERNHGDSTRGPPGRRPAVRAAALCVAGAARSEQALDEIVVTASRMHAPLMVITDPKAPRQPLPAHDGADYLKTIPGFSVIRKGGTDGDPVFRGMAASRVNVLIDGEQLLGGCGMRMDPPTAYVFPEAYDRIVVTKGPQTVLRGPGNSAATVSFERDVKRFESRRLPREREPARRRASAAATSWATCAPGTPSRLRPAHRHARRLRRLRGRRRAATCTPSTTAGAPTLRSAGRRTSTRASSSSGARSDGEAAYADRAMDGVEVRSREPRPALRARTTSSAHVKRVEAQAYYNYVDHVMDNYSLRTFTPTATMPFAAVSNPDRRTTGGRVAVDLAARRRAQRLTVGVDLQDNRALVCARP